MCGIVGILSPRRELYDLLPKLRDRLAHRGPDGAGAYFSSDGRVALGHRRLAIIDLSSAADQPFRSADGRFTLVFNGEIYDHEEHRRALHAAGIHLRTKSDTEVLLNLLIRDGVAALLLLAGQWAFALWDEVERTLFCARDRVGEKPLYWAEVDGDFVFASELKSIVAHPAFRRDLDDRALIDVLTFGFVVPPKTVYARARQLPPGSCLTVHFPTGQVPIVGPVQRYWKFEPRADPSAGGPDEIRTVLERVAAEMTVADVPVGAFLSGGVDSSSVVTALSRGGHRLTAHTIGFVEDAWDETKFAREVAERAQVPHRVTTLRAEEALDQFDRLLAHFDEPFADSSALPTAVLCREARRSSTVALSGDGADEIFGGYRRYQRVVRRAEFRSSGARRAAVRVAAALAGLAPRGTARTLRQYAGADADVMADMLSVISTRRDQKGLYLGSLSQAAREYGPEEVVRERLRELSADAHPIDQMRALDISLTLGSGILVKVDRASMAVALEVRPVFVHRDLLALAARIPAARLATTHRAKVPLRDAFSPWFSPGFLERKKQGFALPLPTWIREGRGPFGELLSLPHLSDRIDRRAFQDLVRAQRGGGDESTALVHALVHLDRWIEHWVVRGGTDVR